MIDHLPEPARRWLLHSIAPGTGLARAARLSMRGTIRIGAWRPFTAHQVIRPDVGFVWTARSRIAGLPVHGFDRYLDGAGEMRWRLAGLIPVMSAHGPDVTRSAAGRLAGESVFVPTSLVSAEWRPAGEDSATFVRTYGATTSQVTITVSAIGQLRRVSLIRWGNPNGSGFGDHTFTVRVDAELAVSGLRIPRSLVASWSDTGERADDAEFFRAHIDAATFC